MGTTTHAAAAAEGRPDVQRPRGRWPGRRRLRRRAAPQGRRWRRQRRDVVGWAAERRRDHDYSGRGAGHTSPGPSYDEPQPSDFELNVKVLQKENFGEAGSNVTFRIEAAWDKTYHPSKTYEVTYEVRGTEGGPMINTFTVTGDRYETTKEELAQTPSTSTKLTARVTDVEEA
jgi:hypothetical protein